MIVKPSEESHPLNGCRQPQTCGMEVRGVYDGVLYWFCLSCGAAWQRWQVGNRLHALAAPYIAADNGPAVVDVPTGDVL